MKEVFINEHLCPQNHWCPARNMCPSEAITQKTPFSAPEIDKEKCTNCGVCLKFCPYGAFREEDLEAGQN